MGSLQVPNGGRSPLVLETSCGYLLQELQMIWDEVGEDQFEREKVLVDIEQECLEVYRRKVDNANISRARLHQELADAQAEFTHLLLSLGERSLPLRPEKMAGTLKEQLHSISPALKEMQLRREERVKQFRAVQSQIQKISGEIAGRSEYNDTSSSVVVSESDLSLKKLEEFQHELQRLQNEKCDRLQRVEKYMGTIQNLSATLGMDPSMIITKVHPSLNALSGLSKNIGDVIQAKLHSTVKSLETEKQKRLEKLHQLGKTLINLWNLMDTHHQDRQRFSHVTGLSSVSSSDICTPGSLTLDIIQQAEIEVNRLDQLKASKMKELFLRKQLELEEICNQSHVEIPSRPEIENLMNLINSGEIDHADLLMTMDDQISKALEEACSRKPIMEKVEKWILASEEERWLEEYNRDENRYSVSRGAHRNLKRAERARLMVNKIPALVDLLITKTKNWEEERNKVFLYDEVPLLAMLEEYNTMRKEREEEKQRQREMKKIQTQAVVLITEQGNVFGSRPSTGSRAGYDSPMNSRRLSVGSQLSGMISTTLTSPIHGNSVPFSRGGRKARGQRAFCRAGISSHLREDTASVVSSFSGPRSP